MKRITLLLLLIVLVLVVNQAWAMSSTHYKLDWFTVTGSGGGPAASAHYAANFTVGQTAVGASVSTNYKVGLGYWYGAMGGSKVYLPLILK